ncbi:hypothetical protein DXG03_004789 [Asterophora parasitica]|uniref:Uncharacterized protein n=1 Tax=Asterophora parasitica TaxID=117018 RepID=A0A9P7G2F1_9AGAR|nr:hypothetical protein DXG03_004789 [Asterophora parasitica]
MTGLSPSRVRTKTSELADFFRGQPSRHIQHHPVEGPPQSALLEIPQTEDLHTKKMSTRIPFLGRTRKKSTHSMKSGGKPSATRGYESEVAESSASKKDRRLSHPVPPPEPASRHPPLPAALPQINVPSQSLGSKFVAQFSYVKSRKATPSPRSPQAGPSEGSMSGTLSPPITPRAASFDSASTSASANHPSTPRAGPTITVSASPDNMEDYKDLFTLPRHKTSAAPRRQSSTPASEYRDNYHKTESSVTLTPSPPTSPRTNHSATVHDARTSSFFRSEVKEREARRLADIPRSSKVARKETSSVRRLEDSTPDDSTEESARQVHSADLAPVIDVTPPPPPPKASSPVSRSRLRTASSVKDPASTPPSIPLPAPPTITPTLSLSSPPSPILATTTSASVRPLTRPRANTIGSVPPSPQIATITGVRSSSPSKRTIKLSNETPSAAKQRSNKENASDLDAMTPGQLRQALLTRNTQYEDLAAHYLEVTQAHAAEKSALEKKIALLEADAMRRDKEIQGFTWMLNNGGKVTPDFTQIPGPRTHRSPSSSSKPSSRRFQYTDDSGAESHATSGVESVSAMSGCVKKGLRPLTLGESSSYNIYRSKPAAGRGPAVDSGISDHSQRTSTSVYSASSSTSATSSASSLVPPSPGIPISSLSAIPEVGTVSSDVSEISMSPTRDSLSASEWETDDRRWGRAARRMSTSSSSSAATSAYSSNLGRGRPPSIAQVLQKSPTMDESLEKLRPFTGKNTACT